jgi:hypothetical protein
MPSTKSLDKNPTLAIKHLMQTDKKGMSNHKHGISGHSGKSPKAKLMNMMDANRLEEAERQKKRSQKATMYQTVQEALKNG